MRRDAGCGFGRMRGDEPAIADCFMKFEVLSSTVSGGGFEAGRPVLRAGMKLTRSPSMNMTSENAAANKMAIGIGAG